MLRAQDYLFVTGVFLISALICVATFHLPSPWNITSPLLGTLVVLLVVLSIYYRNLLRHLENQALEEQRHALVHSKQTEASIWLSSLVKVRQPLPFMRGMAISPDFAVLLLSTILKYKPQVIVELGCGTSTLLSSYALEQQGSGKVVSIDHDEKFAAICRNQLADHRLSDRATIHHCPLVPQVVNNTSYRYYDLSRLQLPERIDILVVDGPPMWIQKEARYPALPLLMSRLSPSAVVLVDDAGRPDELAIVDRWMKKYDCFDRVYLETEKGTSILYRKG
jgi:predicted O-methyltransferase YrrM